MLRLRAFLARLRKARHIKESDVDLLVRFNQPKSLFGIVGLEIELSEILGRKVDLVTERALCPHIKESVLANLQPFYGK